MYPSIRENYLFFVWFVVYVVVIVGEFVEETRGCKLKNQTLSEMRYS